MAEFEFRFEGFERVIATFGPDLEGLAVECARMAVNDTAKWVVSREGDIKKTMQRNVAFPPGYLNGGDRMMVSRYASDSNLSADVFARGEPTSLARFALDAGTREGVMVRTKTSGGGKLIKGAWLTGLKRGEAKRGNVGLMIRSPTKPKKAYKPRQFMDDPNLWLLYGPSVYQVFRQSLSEFEPIIVERMENRFDRHWSRELKRKGLK